MAIKSLLLFRVSSLSSSWIVLFLGIIEGRPPIKGSNLTYKDCRANAWAASFPEPCCDKKSKLEGSVKEHYDFRSRAKDWFHEKRFTLRLDFLSTNEVKRWSFFLSFGLFTWNATHVWKSVLSPTWNYIWNVTIALFPLSSRIRLPGKKVKLSSNEACKNAATRIPISYYF